MAAAPVKQRTGGSRAQLPPCYYEGYLEKRGPKEKVSRRLWTCLCGNSLYFFNNTKDTHYVEKLDLSGFVSLADDCSRDRNLEAARFSLRLKDGETKLTAPNLEARELWKGFLYAVVDLSIPSSLTLLPGQLLMLKEVVEREKHRRKTRSLSRAPSSPLSLPLLGEIPPCFRPVSRVEAEVLLERYPDCGNMLLRPGRDGTSLAVTTRQDLNGSVFRHYRVTQKHQGGYVIDVENPIPCETLYDVINALVEKTSGTLQPFLLEEPYEENITFVSSNDENGERTLHCVRGGTPVRGPVLPPKQGTDKWSPRHQALSQSPSPRSFSPTETPLSPMKRLTLSPSPLAQRLLDEQIISAFYLQGETLSMGILDAVETGGFQTVFSMHQMKTLHEELLSGSRRSNRMYLWKHPVSLVLLVRLKMKMLLVSEERSHEILKAIEVAIGMTPGSGDRDNLFRDADFVMDVMFPEVLINILECGGCGRHEAEILLATSPF